MPTFMSYRKLFSDVFKYVQFRNRHAVMNNVFFNGNATVYGRSLLIQHVAEDNNNEETNSLTKSQGCIMLSAGLLSLFDFWNKKEDTPELIMTLKRSILMIQRGDYKTAEKLLHIALNQAQTLQSYDGITYTYDLLANVAFDTGNYNKAHDLFINVLQRLITTGTQENDPKVIHISLKIARIFEKLGDLEKAEHGYSFCLENLRNHLAQNSDSEILTLLGMTLDWYSHMLLAQSRYSDALKYLKEAYEICVKLNGEIFEQSVVLLNDLGTLYYAMGQYDLALEHLSKAAKTGSSLVDMVEFGSIHVNLGNIFLKKAMVDEARKACEKGRMIAKSRDDDNTIKQADKCLDLIRKHLLSVKK